MASSVRASGLPVCGNFAATVDVAAQCCYGIAEAGSSKLGGREPHESSACRAHNQTRKKEAVPNLHLTYARLNVFLAGCSKSRTTHHYD